MKGTYAYSFDRENFTGVFETRQEAVSAGLTHARNSSLGLTRIFVGQRVSGDPQANLHAWAVIKSMRERAKSAYGDDANTYLAAVTASQAEDLDRALEATISRWLANYKLSPTFFRIESLSEHPVPVMAQVAFATDDDEVYDLGESNW